MGATKKYKVSLKLGDTVLKGSGVTMLEALLAMPSPVKIVTKAILSASGKEGKCEQVLTPIRTRQMLYPISKVFTAKQLMLLLK